jgi:hypothetical protein
MAPQGLDKIDFAPGNGNYILDLGKVMCHVPAADSKESAGAPEKEIEVTPAMIEAGYRVLEASCITDDLLEADRGTVSEIYLAMYRTRLATC